jgi:hypothetical protein
MNLAAKLQLKPGQTLAMIGRPENMSLDLDAGAEPADADALIVFCTNRAELDARRDSLRAKALRDDLTWVAYPKAGQLGTDLSRDTVARLLVPDGIRPVRQIALDDVWSALRFRPA